MSARRERHLVSIAAALVAGVSLYVVAISGAGLLSRPRPGDLAVVFGNAVTDARPPG